MKETRNAYTELLWRFLLKDGGAWRITLRLIIGILAVRM
jgi:hypothetical protein